MAAVESAPKPINSSDVEIVFETASIF